MTLAIDLDFDVAYSWDHPLQTCDYPSEIQIACSALTVRYNFIEEEDSFENTSIEDPVTKITIRQIPSCNVNNCVLKHRYQFIWAFWFEPGPDNQYPLFLLRMGPVGSRQRLVRLRDSWGMLNSTVRLEDLQEA